MLVYVLYNSVKVDKSPQTKGGGTSPSSLNYYLVHIFKLPTHRQDRFLHVGLINNLQLNITQLT